MDKIKNKQHGKETFYYSISRMLERASYYGFRALLVIYMIGETIQMERTEAITIYGFLVGSIVFSQIIGGLFGDLLIGNKKSIIIGGIIQAIGAFTLCIPTTMGLYLGLFLVVLGSGFFSPNMIANYGKLYLKNTKLLDAGFTMFYLAINLGSILGILLIGYVGETYSFTLGFVISGLLMLISLVPIFMSKQTDLDEIKKSEFSISKRVLNILIALIVVGLFWGFYEITSIRMFDLQFQISEVSTLDIPKHFWQSMNAFLMLPVGVFAIFLWTYYYSSQFFKVMVGFIFGAISFGILFFIPEVPTEKHTFTYLISLLLLVISELHIAPIIHSILTKYSNPKYLAILISLAFVPTRLISLIFGLFSDSLYSNPMLGLKIGVIGMTLIGIALLGYVILSRKKYI